MTRYFVILILVLIGCRSKSDNKIDNSSDETVEKVKSKELEKIDEDEMHFRDSLYTGESENYISKIEEIPNREDDAYRITIESKNGNWEKTKVIDTRPQMSRISYCNDLYTIVSFACGGPCHSEVFVFTSKARPDEQYSYVEVVKNKPTIITHFKNEEFEKLLVRNLANNKEMTVAVSKNSFISFEFIDSITLNNNILKIHYSSENERQKIKTTNIKTIL